MDKFKYFTVILFISSLLILASALSFIKPEPTQNITIQMITSKRLVVTLPLQEDYDLELGKIYNIVYDNSLYRKYKLHKYDCTNFSIRLVDKLKKEGYDAHCVAGNYWSWEYTNHTWVYIDFDNGERLYIEPTPNNLHFIQSWEFDEDWGYEIWKEDYCW